jgi:hypothetical protein
MLPHLGPMLLNANIIRTFIVYNADYVMDSKEKKLCKLYLNYVMMFGFETVKFGQKYG